MRDTPGPAVRAPPVGQVRHRPGINKGSGAPACRLLLCGPLPRDPTSLCLSFLVCKAGEITVPSARPTGELNRQLHGKTQQSLTRAECSASARATPVCPPPCGWAPLDTAPSVRLQFSGMKAHQLSVSLGPAGYPHRPISGEPTPVRPGVWRGPSLHTRSHMAQRPPGSIKVTILPHDLQSRLLPRPAAAAPGAWTIPWWQDTGTHLKANQTQGHNK